MMIEGSRLSFTHLFFNGILSFKHKEKMMKKSHSPKELISQKIALSVLAVLLLLVAGCGAGVKKMVGEQLMLDETYLKGVKRTVNAGDFMTSSAPFPEQETLILKAGLAATTAHRGEAMALTAAPGEYVLVRQHEEGKFYEAAERLVTLNGMERAGGLFLPSSPTSRPALYWSSAWAWQVDKKRRLAMYIADLNVNPNVTITTYPTEPDYANGLVSTLTYAGMAGGEVKFSYREFKDGMARDAFTQEVALDYQPGDEYVYKNARFIIHNASTTEITFTLLEPL